MGITARRTGGRLDDLVLVDAQLMKDVGLLARTRILRRTRAGEDVDGAPFAPYSDAYAKAKRAALGTSGGPLEASGNMLRDLSLVEVTETSVTLGWSQ